LNEIKTLNFKEKIMALAITDATLRSSFEIRQTSWWIFWAAWCGPCRMVGPIIELGTEYDGKVVVGKVDVDANQEFAANMV
jgi:thioredoxin 1